MFIDEFTVLTSLQECPSPPPTQRELARTLSVSLGKVNYTLKSLKQKGFVSEDNEITQEGYLALEPYRVKNAVILAAGLSSRLAPLSFEKPKGLLTVRGEVLIERQIRQLKEVGIDDITVVVGYLKEQFFYLEEKFGVKLIINEDYWKYNNISSVALILDKLSNTYLCSSDNYFIENPFKTYEYRPYYSAEYASGKTEEYCLQTDNKGLITGVYIGGENSWYMIGHVYFDHNFSQKFIELFKKDFIRSDIKEKLWEDFYIEHLDTLKLYLKENKGNIFEFDSVEELRQFDPESLRQINSRILNNIAQIFNCTVDEITNIKKIKEGMTNNSFAFNVGDKRYVYRHPGRNTDYINRKSEYFSMKVAKELGLDKTFIEMNADEGWKLSYFIDAVKTLDYGNKEQVCMALSKLRKLHEAKVHSEFDFDVWEKINNFKEKLASTPKVDYPEFSQLSDAMDKLRQFVESDPSESILCHCDSYAPNFMIHQGDMELIDWEYSGNSDPAFDLGVFICCSENYSYEDALEILKIYYQRELSPLELRHCLAYIAIASYYWFVWALFQESSGRPVGSYLYLWHKCSKLYLDKSLRLYSMDK